MGYPANPRTDERGHQLVGLFTGGMKTVPLVQERVDPWSINVGRMKKQKVGDLLGEKSPYHLIGNCLVNEKKCLATKECKCGKFGSIRKVIVDGREYRSDAYRLFERRVKS